jgi:1-acyl-sn-glycerol-3-phosphate acyltransferase
MRDLVYPPVVGFARTAFKVLDLKFQLTGTENVPRTGGAVIALNHISYVDFVLGGRASGWSGSWPRRSCSATGTPAR